MTTSTGLIPQLRRRKPMDAMVGEAGAGHDVRGLVRSLGVVHLTSISIGATLGTGIYLRRARPELPRSFRMPLFPLTPLLGALVCLYLLLNLDGVTWRVFGAWMLVGVLVYLLHSRRHSRLAAASDSADEKGLTR